MEFQLYDFSQKRIKCTSKLIKKRLYYPTSYAKKYINNIFFSPNEVKQIIQKYNL